MAYIHVIGSEFQSNFPLAHQWVGSGRYLLPAPWWFWCPFPTFCRLGGVSRIRGPREYHPWWATPFPRWWAQGVSIWGVIILVCLRTAGLPNSTWSAYSIGVEMAGPGRNLEEL